MKTKKILICNGFSSLNTGGTEEYCRTLKAIFESNDYVVEELCLFLENNITTHNVNINYVFKNSLDFQTNLNSNFWLKLISKIPFTSGLISHIFQSKCWIQRLKDLEEKNNYDCIIFNLNVMASYKDIASKSISIQHCDFKYIKSICFSLRRKIIDAIFNIKSHYLYSNKIVCFTQNDKKLFSDNFSNKKIYPIPLYFKDIKFDNCIHREKRYITYFSRYDNSHKNSDLIFDLFDNSDLELLVISDNVPEEIKNKYNNVLFYTPKNRDDGLREMYKKAKAAILISEIEGFPFVLVDALSIGIPVIIRNSFTNASFLTEYGKGILLPKKINKDNYLNIIAKTDFSHFNNKKIIEFSKIFQKQKFDNEWLKIIDSLKNSK